MTNNGNNINNFNFKVMLFFPHAVSGHVFAANTYG